MPVLPQHAATVHEMHGSRFHAFVSPSLGSSQLCAWRVEVAPGQRGAPHTVTHEEVFLALAGAAALTLDGERHDVRAGDVVLVPAGSTLRLDNPADEPATLWVTTSVGLTAVTEDGQRITPPWTR